ncbi:MAG TPA: hypothetical protein VHS96_14825 [Bacteroidia bacterium]|nr:hypothetical protein [Bacteroidia bacterium]
MKRDLEFEGGRAELLARLRLLKSNYDLRIEQLPDGLFDFFVTEEVSKVKFAVVVKLQRSFESAMRKYISSINETTNNRMLNCPVMVMKVDPEKEMGWVDLLAVPNENGVYQIRTKLEFLELTSANIDKLIQRLIGYLDAKKILAS